MSKLFLNRRPRTLLTEAEINELEAISWAPGESPRRVERALILLAHAQGATYAEIAEQLAVTKAKVKNTLERARKMGAVAALSDRKRRGRPRQITPESRAWVVALAHTDPRSLGYSRTAWTLDLLAQHAREHCREHGHPDLTQVARNTVVKILTEHETQESQDEAGAEEDPELDASSPPRPVLPRAPGCHVQPSSGFY